MAQIPDSDIQFVFPVREPDVAYRDSMLWLPKNQINEWSLKAAFTVELQDRVLVLWRETEHHILVPREAFDTERLDCELIIVEPEYPTHEFEDNVYPRDTAQLRAWRDLREADRGILNLACGLGKTVMALKKIAHRGHPALVVVNTGALMDQWAKEAREFLNLGDDDIGFVQGKRFEGDRPLVIAMIQTLAGKHLFWPRWFRQRFGTVVYDEVHHLSAPTFSRTASLFPGMRIGLTATPEREDGTEFVYQGHLGKVFHSNLEQKLKPKIVFHQLPTEIKDTDPRVVDRSRQFNISKYRKCLTRLDWRNEYIVSQVLKAQDHGRRILVLGHIKEGVRRLSEMIPESTVVTGDIPPRKRLALFHGHQVVIATMNVANEGLDVPELDTVFFTTPFGNWASMQQGMGRILREREGKRTPVVTIFEDAKVGMSKGLCNKLRRGLREHGHQWKKRKYDLA